jgi:glycosyltransferase involved in cell wall biosynthesis
MILSILIATIPERYPVFIRLLNDLMRQVYRMNNEHPTLGMVEIIFDDSVKFTEGGKSIGGKRNDLRQRATGKYSIFLDDDEVVAPNYVETIVRMCQKDADVVTFRVLFKSDHYWSVLNLSLENKKDEQANPDDIIQRRVWHVCAIKTDITKKEHFSEINHNEDGDWLKRIIPLLKSEVHTDAILLQYNHSEENSEADKILKLGYR